MERPPRVFPGPNMPSQKNSFRQRVVASLHYGRSHWRARILILQGQLQAFWLALLKDLRRGHRHREPVTGLRLQPGLLEWTTLCKGREALEKLATQQERLVVEEAAWSDPAQLATLLRQQYPQLGGAMALAFSSAQMLMRVIDLPSTEPAEMAGMIKLQLDKFSPFPEERMALAYELLHPTASGGRVLVVTVPKAKIEFMGAVFQKAGWELQRVDAEVLGWWRLLVDQRAVPAAGRCLLLRLEQDGGLLLAVQDGLLLALKALTASAGLTAEEYAAEIAYEMRAFLLALDLEQGALPLQSLHFWHSGAAPELVLARLRAELHLEIQLHQLETLPPLSEGAARRMLSPLFQPSAPADPAALDLIPASWRASDQASRMKRRLIAATLIILVGWLLTTLAFLGGYTWSQQRLQRLQQRLATVQKPAEEVRTLQRWARSFEQCLDRQHSALECLREISQLLPADVSLTAFQFRKGKNVILRGEALSVNPIYDFKQALDKSKLFKKVDLGSTQPSRRKAAMVQTFQMTIHLPEEQP